MSDNKKELFEYVDSNNNDQQIEISKEDFEIVNKGARIHDVKFKSKPTTFLKDAFRRFRKNKSSVAGGIILGILLLGAIILPVALPSDIDSPHLDEQFLEPKLFPSGTGFWDGTKKYTDFKIAYDTVNETPGGFSKEAVLDNTLELMETEINTVNDYAYGGYVNFYNSVSTTSTTSMKSYPIEFNFENDYSLHVEFGKEPTSTTTMLGSYSVTFSYLDGEEQKDFLIRNFSNDYSDLDVNLTDLAIAAGLEEKAYSNCSVSFNLDYESGIVSQLLVKKCTVGSSNSEEQATLDEVFFDDANKMVRTARSTSGVDNIGYWTSTGNKGVYKSTLVRCNFVYDTYVAKFGHVNQIISQNTLNNYIQNGWMSYDVNVGVESFKILDENKCPITKVYSQTYDSRLGTVSLNCEVLKYRYLGYDEMPIYLLGTDKYGKDLLHSIFAGLRTSLLLGFGTAAVCITFGIIWGSISGYFGGNIDIVMERFTDILSGIPWIVIMTLCILHLGNNFGTFILALCLTGWIGVSSLTRSQFYRFKGREYVLAARTLGASDFRLIFKHILPNSIGTLVTSCVLIIPSVIFNEATISYLNLGLQGLPSLGVTLSENQQFINSYPYLIIWPSVIVALMMISFNLFGNGLRDAFNPSLKGSD